MTSSTEVFHIIPDALCVLGVGSVSLSVLLLPPFDCLCFCEVERDNQELPLP